SVSEWADQIPGAEPGAGRRLRCARAEPPGSRLALQRARRRMAAFTDAGGAVRGGATCADDPPRASGDRLPAALALDDRPPDPFLPAAVQPAPGHRLEDDPRERPRRRQGPSWRSGDHPPVAIDRQGVQVLHACRRVRPRRRDPAAADLPALPAGRQPGTDPHHGRAPAEAGWRTERSRRPRRSRSVLAGRRCLPNFTKLPLTLIGGTPLLPWCCL